jgi:hypothetical protein
MYRHAEKGAFNPLLPRRAELHSVDVRCDINPHGCDTDLVDNSLFRERLGCQSVVTDRGSNPGERLIQARRVLGRIAGPHAQVFGVAWFGILHDSVAAHNQVLHLALIQDA